MRTLLRLQLHRVLFRPLINGIRQLNQLSKSITNWRVDQGERLANKDLFSALLNAKDPESGCALTHDELVSEAGLLIVAGTDTTITAISASIFYLLHNPTCLEALKSEIRGSFSELEEVRIGPQLETCQYLTACITEILRMSPPVGSLLPREVLDGGIVVDGERMPAGADLGVPHYALHHNEEYFHEPFRFRPERWDLRQAARARHLGDDTETDLALAQGAFATFGVGRTSCVGKHLAYQEIKLVLARMIWLYDMRLQPGSTLGVAKVASDRPSPEAVEYRTLDRFVSMHDGPMVQFRAR